MPEQKSVFPTSFAQDRLWFLERLDPGSVDYNACQAARMRGPLNVAALEWALNEIVRRHDTLRTTFEAREGVPMQVVTSRMTLPLPITDLTHLGPDGEAQAQVLAATEARRPFDLQRGPLLRSTLLRLGPQDHLLLLSIHHIVYDAWSDSVLWSELSALYSAFVAGKPSPLPELPIQYSDFAVWQRQWLQGETLRQQVVYWREQLAGAPPWLDLPICHPRAGSLTREGQTLLATFPPHLPAAITALSRRERVTPFMTLLAALAVLLSRYSGQEDMVIGVPVASRNRIEIEHLIGFFVNTLAMRVKLSGNPSFQELLRRVREMALDVYEHQDLPFEKLVEELQPERHLSRPPIFQVLFQLANAPQSPPQLAGLQVERRMVPNGRSKFDLSLALSATPMGLSARLEYLAALFDDTTARCMTDHYQTLLESIVAHPEMKVGSLPILTPAERRHLLVDWAGSDAPYPVGKCLHELVQEQVQRTPDAVAVRCGNQSLTYGELNAQANRLARHLRRLGVGPESLVGICLERSPELVVTVLAVLKAGGAYVPLEPEHPRDRLAFVVGETQVRWIVTRQDLLPRLPRLAARAPSRGDAATVLCWDRDLPLALAQPGVQPVAGDEEANLHCSTSPDNLAYVIYTSGSTGRPKGVLVPHRGVVNYLSFYTGAYGLAPADVVLQLPPLSFDASVRDLIGPLTFGGQVVLAHADDIRDPRALLRLIAERGVTCLLSVVVTLLASLVQAADDDEGTVTESLRLILTTGEPLPTDLLRRIPAAFGPQVAVVNQYGPTETTMISTYYPAVAGPAERSTVPIGRPIANVRVYILDREGNPVPIGVRGEIYIGGVGVTRGYLNHPELTAASFVPDPFARPGARLYRTGDLARCLPDGNLEFLRRADQQVKIRGNRVELGEIETVLCEHPAVRQAVAVLRQDPPGEPSLVAYVVLASGHSDALSQCRVYLKEKLPAYMVPAGWVALDALPLTATGKVDRGALPLPVRQRAGLESKLAAPRNATEEMLTTIFAQVLQMETVGIHDGFFDLGGHSLQATQVVARVRHVFGIELPLRTLFETPTVAGLGEILRRMQSNAVDRSLAQTGQETPE